MLTHWVRDRASGRLSVAEAVRELTSVPARVAGLADRGRIAVGYKADLNVIDARGAAAAQAGHRPRPARGRPPARPDRRRLRRDDRLRRGDRRERRAHRRPAGQADPRPSAGTGGVTRVAPLARRGATRTPRRSTAGDIPTAPTSRCCWCAACSGIRRWPPGCASWANRSTSTPRLPPRVRTIAILRICALVRCEYEWGGQAAFWGPIAGVTDDECDALVDRRRRRSALERRRTRRSIGAVDELERTGSWSEQTWNRTRRQPR